MFQDMLVAGSGGGGGSFTVSVEAAGAGGHGDHIGSFSVIAPHPFKKVKVLSYTNIESSYSTTPQVIVNGTVYNRPAVNAEFDVTGVPFTIQSDSLPSNYVTVGITCELSY